LLVFIYPIIIPSLSQYRLYPFVADLLLPADVSAAWDGKWCLAETAAVAVITQSQGKRALKATNFLLGFETFVKPPPPPAPSAAFAAAAASAVAASGEVPLRSSAEGRLMVAGSLFTAESAARIRSLFAAATAVTKKVKTESDGNKDKTDVVLLSGLCGRGKGHNNFTDLQLTLSHLAAIRRAVHENVTSSRYALIAEDDVAFPFDVDW
jgi:hypothetical protein